MKDSLWAIRCVWLRYFDVYCKSLVYALLTTFLEPLLYVLSFGFGMGGMIGQITVAGVTLSYRQFVLAGLVGQTMLVQSFFDAAYGGFVRMYYQRIFKAMAVTPITLSEVLWGELLWDSTKSTFATSILLLIGVLLGDFSPWGALALLPICYLCSLLFSGLGLYVAASSQSIEQINYPQYLLVFPMFLFCGVYFPLERLPIVIQYFAHLLPLTAILSIVRSFTLGLPFEWLGVGVVAIWLVLTVTLSRRAMTARLIK